MSTSSSNRDFFLQSTKSVTSLYFYRNVSEIDLNNISSLDSLHMTIIPITNSDSMVHQCIIVNSFSVKSSLGKQEMHIVDVTNDNVLKSFFLHDCPAKLQCSYNSNIASCSKRNEIEIIDVLSGSKTHSFSLHPSEILRMALHSTKQCFLSLVLAKKGDKYVHVFDVQSKSFARTLKGHSGSITSISVVELLKPTLEDVIVTCSKDQTCRTWTLSSGSARRVFQHDDKVSASHMSSNGDLFTACCHGSIYLWKEASGVLLKRYQSHQCEVTCINVFEKLVMTGGVNGSIMIWDSQSETFIAGLNGHQGSVKSIVAVHGVQVTLISCSSDGSSKQWSLEKLKDDYFKKFLLCVPYNIGRRNKRIPYGLPEELLGSSSSSSSKVSPSREDDDSKYYGSVILPEETSVAEPTTPISSLSKLTGMVRRASWFDSKSVVPVVLFQDKVSVTEDKVQEKTPPQEIDNLYIDISKLHPALPPLSPVIRSQVTSRVLERRVMRSADQGPPPRMSPTVKPQQTDPGSPRMSIKPQQIESISNEALDELVEANSKLHRQQLHVLSGTEELHKSELILREVIKDIFDQRDRNFRDVQTAEEKITPGGIASTRLSRSAGGVEKNGGSLSDRLITSEDFPDLYELSDDEG